LCEYKEEREMQLNLNIEMKRKKNGKEPKKRG